MTTKIDVEIIAKIDLFKGLDEKQLKKVYNRFSMGIHSPGTVLFEQDDPGDGLYIIQYGSISLTFGESGRVTHEFVLNQGQFIGEFSLFASCPRMMNARVMETASIARLSRTSFHELANDEPAIAVVIYKNLGKRLVAPFLLYPDFFRKAVLQFEQ